MTAQNAFVLRLAPLGIDRVPEALELNHLIIGWARAKGLLYSALNWETFRDIIRVAHYAEEHDFRKAGAAAGHMWRFIREMKTGDLVVVPHGAKFYVAEVAGPAFYDESKLNEGSAYRRPVVWRNDKKGIPRSIAKSALISRMKTQGTCAYATDLLGQIDDCLRLANSGQSRSFGGDLQDRLVRETLDELRSGRMDSFGFERLIQTILTGLGAEEARIVPRIEDKGADVVATFPVAGAFRQVVAVQAKHWQPNPPVGNAVVEQLIRGIEAESANLGMIITTGTFASDAKAAAENYTEETGIKIELVDGEQFA